MHASFEQEKMDEVQIKIERRSTLADGDSRMDRKDNFASFSPLTRTITNIYNTIDPDAQFTKVSSFNFIH
jgi:hypothetical protein